MLPAGYLLKRIVPPPAWLDANGVDRVCSVTSCVNDDVVDVQGAWRHNGHGLANAPTTLDTLAARDGIDTRDAALFFYTAYSLEMEADGWTFDRAWWRPRTRLRSAREADAVLLPAGWPALPAIGYDVVVAGDFIEHSPLSCNGVAARVPVNRHCLFDRLVDAVAAIDNGAFGDGCEPGIYTIYGVYPLARAT